MRTRYLLPAAFACLAGATSAVSQPRVSELRCTVAGGFGFGVGGERAANCVYYRPDGIAEFYLGSSTRVGFDLGPTNAQRLAFKVQGGDLAQPGGLQGNFVGVAGGFTIGEGISAQALMGGASGHVTLLPLGNPNYTGENLAAGLGVLKLRYAGSEPHALHERY